MQGLLWIDAEKTKSGEEAEDEGCSDGEDDGDGEDGEVDADGLGARDGELRVSRETVHGEEGQGYTKDASGEREDEDFGEGGLQEAGCGGSQGGADCGFAVTSDEAGKLRVGEIDAGDEQDAEDRGHEKPEAGGGFADDDFLHGLDVGGEGSVGGSVELAGGNLTSQGVVECVEIFLGLGDGDAGFEASERDVVAVVTVEAEVVEVDGERGEDFVVGKLASERDGGELVGFGEVEVFRKDADDLIWGVADLDGAADDGGVAVIEGLPEMPGEYGDFFMARSGLFGEEVAAEGGLDAEDVEEIRKS